MFDPIPEIVAENIAHSKSLKREVKLPASVLHKTPMPLKADAYTITADNSSAKAREKSVYYLTFRRMVKEKGLFKKGDERIIFHGLSRILDYLFMEATNLYELDETEAFLSTAKVSSKGLSAFPFPKEQWKEVVAKYNGRPPILIKAMPEGSVVYPNEPVVICESMVDGFGELAAWFESNIIKVFSSSELLTRLMHWLEYCYSIVNKVYGKTKTVKEKRYIASLMLHAFGDRAGRNPQESEWLGADALLVFASTDTFSGGYQEWMNGGRQPGIALTISALAHRNVQSFENEEDCYKQMYETGKDGDYMSMVNDCYASKRAIQEMQVKLALRSKEEGNGKVVISRPDSGKAIDEIMLVIQTAIDNGLFVEKEIGSKKWKSATTLKFLEGDGQSYLSMKEIFKELMKNFIIPFEWGVPFGQGGGMFQDIKRDNLSTKYALMAMGNDLQGVCKFSETFGKTTLPGPLKVIRTEEALKNKTTIVGIDEPGEDAMVEYFNGLDIWEPFKEGFGDSHQIRKERIHSQFFSMPKNLTTKENHNFPASEKVLSKRKELLQKYAPSKNQNNY